uniref:Uncharacterized protein n=1 Tax=Romanomermis culicivorax TaxID=13658 RepID=A0A915I706_ROMCU
MKQSEEAFSDNVTSTKCLKTKKVADMTHAVRKKPLKTMIFRPTRSTKNKTIKIALISINPAKMNVKYLSPPSKVGFMDKP